MGDFNAHNPLWYGQRLDARGEEIQNFIEAQNLMILNEDLPTYYRTFDQATSNIDLALITDTHINDYRWSVQDDLNGSDHFPITVSAIQPSPIDFVEKWNLQKADWSKYRDLAITREEVDTMPNLEEAYLHIKNIILNAANNSIPKTKVKETKRPCVPWWTEECKNVRRAVRSTYKTMKRNPNPTTIRIYRRRLALKVRTYRRAKVNSWKQYVSELNQRTPISQVWEKIRKINGKYIPKPRPNLRIGQDLKTSPEEVANVFAEHYASISIAREQHKIPKDFDPINISDDQTLNLDFSERELDESLQQLEDRKSTGEDQVENSMLKRLPAVTKLYLLNLFNRLWNEGTFPSEWKTSIIIPILKSGKEPTNPESYRPISLTSCLCKLFERMVNSRLMWFLETTNKLSKHQYGFRQGRNAVDPIASLTTDIQNGFVEGKITTAVFFDYEKAFDTISR